MKRKKFTVTEFWFYNNFSVIVSCKVEIELEFVKLKVAEPQTELYLRRRKWIIVNSLDQTGPIKLRIAKQISYGINDYSASFDIICQDLMRE